MAEFVPYNYQKYCIDRIIDTPKIGLFLDMGLGKTVTTLTAVKILKRDMFAVRKVLVIAPKKVAEGTWNREKDKWDHTRALRTVLVSGTANRRVRALCTPADIYIIGRDNVTWLVDYYRNGWPFDMVVIDESSSFKNHKAKRWKSIRSVLPKISRIVELTGTPSPNGIGDLWAQIYLLDGGERLYNSYNKFRNVYFSEGARNNGIVYNYRPKPGSYESVLDRIRDICISMKSEDYLELPDIIYDDVNVVLDDRSRRAYEEMERQFVLSIPEDDAEIDAMSAAALSNKLLQIASGAVYDEDHIYHEVHSCKLEALEELLESLEGKPVLLFYNFQHDRDRIIAMKSMKKKRVRVLSSPQDEDDWNNGMIDILLAHPASAAYGLNLQQGGNHIIWFGLTWNYELYAQANKRLHRLGQTDKVFVHHLLCEDTRDDDVKKAITEKDTTQRVVMDSLKARIRKIKENI